MPEAVTILYEDGPCLVVQKPPGLATQAPPPLDSLEVRLKQLLAQRAGAAESIYLGVPHRLDRPVSGAIVFALHRRAAQRLARQFEHRAIRKVYWACVAGIVTPAQGTWRDYVAKILNVPQAKIVPAESLGGENVDLQAARLQIPPREAVLHYRTLGNCSLGTWLEIELETGRYHQIRVQGASRGYPVFGDAMYGSQVSWGPITVDPRERAIALHARLLQFLHPTKPETVTVIAPLSDDWRPIVGDRWEEIATAAKVNVTPRQGA